MKLPRWLVRKRESAGHWDDAPTRIYLNSFGIYWFGTPVVSVRLGKYVYAIMIFQYGWGSWRETKNGKFQKIHLRDYYDPGTEKRFDAHWQEWS